MSFNEFVVDDKATYEDTCILKLIHPCYEIRLVVGLIVITQMAVGYSKLKQ